MRTLDPLEWSLVDSFTHAVSQNQDTRIAVLETQGRPRGWTLAALAILDNWSSHDQGGSDPMLEELRALVVRADAIGEAAKSQLYEVRSWPQVARLLLWVHLVSVDESQTAQDIVTRLDRYIEGVIDLVRAVDPTATSSSFLASGMEFREDEHRFMDEFPETLFISTGGLAEVFHKSPMCRALRSGRAKSGSNADIVEVNRDEALRPREGRQGRRPCEVCFPRWANPQTQIYRRWTAQVTDATVTPQPDRVIDGSVTNPRDARSKPGDVRKVVAGPFTSLSCTITKVDLVEQMYTGTVEIFGRETPVEFTFDQIDGV